MLRMIPRRSLIVRYYWRCGKLPVVLPEALYVAAFRGSEGMV